MAVIYDDDKFRQFFQEFKDAVKYPQALIEGYWAQANCIFDDEGNPLFKACDAWLVVANLTAHMMAIAMKAAKGRQVGFKSSSTIDKVSISMLPPPVKDQFSWWLSSTPYGAMLAALLEAASVGGFFFGGINERGSFRKGGGGFA